MKINDIVDYVTITSKSETKKTISSAVLLYKTKKVLNMLPLVCINDQFHVSFVVKACVYFLFIPCASTNK